MTLRMWDVVACVVMVVAAVVLVAQSREIERLRGELAAAHETVAALEVKLAAATGVLESVPVTDGTNAAISVDGPLVVSIGETTADTELLTVDGDGHWHTDDTGCRIRDDQTVDCAPELPAIVPSFRTRMFDK